MAFGDIFGILAIAAGFIFVLIAIRVRNQYDRLKTYVPVDDIRTMPGEIPVIVKGTVTCITPLTSPLTQQPCIYYNYSLEKQETQVQNGSTETVWKTLDQDEERVPFYIQDQTGKMLIKPDKASIRDVNKTQKLLMPGTLNTSSNQWHQILAGIINSPRPGNSPQERATEQALFTQTEVNVFGILSMEGNEQFFQNTKDYPLIITTKSRDQLIQSEKNSSWLYFLFAGAMIIVGAYLLTNQPQLILWKPK
jgi:Ca2+/Na+ antiporter